MMLCQSYEIDFVESRIKELEFQRDSVSNVLEKRAFDRLIYCYENLLNSIRYM